MNRCAFVNLYTGRRARPCPKCAERREPFRHQTPEVRGDIEWWAAENDRGEAVFFRVFPPNRHGLSTTPSQRFAGIELGYRKHVAALRAKYGKHYRRKPRRARLWVAAKAAAEYGRYARFGEPAKFRPAYACEVMVWLASHLTDLQSIEDSEAILSDLETYLP